MGAAPKQVPTLPQMAREALASTSGNTEAATAALVEQLSNDRSLLRTVLSQVVRDAVSYRVEQNMRDRRRAIIVQASRSNVVALAGGIAASMLDMPLANGVRLRDASREQVTAQADRYESMSNDMSRKSRWLRLIAQAVPDTARVGDVVTDARASELWESAQ